MATLMKVTVERAGGERDTYTVKPVTVVAFERQFGVGLGSLSHDPKMEYIYWLAWDAERRSGKVVPTFDSWLENIEAVDSEDEPDPFTSPGATPVS